MRQFYLPLDPKSRTLEQIQEDIVTYLFVMFMRDRVDCLKVANLHSAWPVFLHELKLNGLVVEGFYRGYVSERYRALDKTIFALMHMGWVKPSERPDKIELRITIYEGIRFQADAVPEEWKAVERAFPIFKKAYYHLPD
jgi:hypothetical protein